MRIRTILFGVASILILWGLYADYGLKVARFFTENPDLNLQGVGAWGDSFGSFNALVSTVGTAVIVWTLVLQQQALREQARDSHVQQFDRSFFTLLRLLRELRDQIRFQHNEEFSKEHASHGDRYARKVVHVGLDAINEALIEILYWQNKQKNDKITTKQMSQLYSKVVWTSNDTTFSPYLRIIYTMLYRIDNDKVLSQSEKWQYSNLLRNQITERELYILAYNCKHKVSKDLEKLLVEFRMFKYMSSTKARRKIEDNFDPVIFEPRT